MKEGGWLYAELLVALSILALFFSLALPGVHSLYQRWQMEATLQLFRSELELAQTEAISFQTPVTVRYDPESVQVYRGSDLQRIWKIPDGCRVDGNFPNRQITFRPSGQVQGGTVEWKCSDLAPLCLVVQVASGRLSIRTE
jgi:type II secretory pathway pseudopilin PulG